MFKKALFIILACAACMSTYAQKEYVVVKPFKAVAEANQEACDRVQAAVVNAIVSSQRFNVVDENTASTVPGEVTKYVLEANVGKLSYAKTVVEGKDRYKGVISYSVSVIDIDNNTSVATLNVNQTTAITEETPEEAKAFVISLIDDEVKKFIIKEFPLIGEIFGEDIKVKKDKLKECYISLGSEDGVKKGDRFTVHEVKMRVGKEVEDKSIGRLKIIEVYDDMSLCEVTWGERKVKEAMDRYLENSADDPDTKRLRAKMSLNIWDKTLESL